MAFLPYRTVRDGVLLLAGCAVLAPGQTRIDLGRQARNVDFSSAASTKPSKSGTSLPATCSVGEEFFKTDAPPGQNKYGCTAANTWNLLGAVALLPGQRGNDFALTAAAAALTVAPGNRLFGVMTLSSAGCSYTITAGTISGLAYVYFTDSGQVVVDHPAGTGRLTLSATGTDCQSNAVATPDWPSGMNFHPIGSVAIDAGHWGAVTQAPVLTAGWYVACSAHLECAYANGTVVVDVGPSVLTAGGANALTGSLDASLAESLALPQGVADPAACARAGQLFFNTGSTTLKTSIATGPPCQWAPAGGPLDATVISHRDDFGYHGGAPPASETPWNAYAAPGAISFAWPAGDAAHPGVLRMGTRSATPAAGDTAAIVKLDAATAALYPNLAAAGSWNGHFILMPDSSGAAGPLANTTVYAGWAAQVVFAPPAAFVGAAVSTTAVACTSGAVTTGHWYFVASNGAGSQCLDSGVAAQALAWYRVDFTSTAPGAVSVALNGTTVGTLNAYLPAVALSPGVRVITSAAAQKTVDVDLYAFQQRGLAR